MVLVKTPLHTFLRRHDSRCCSAVIRGTGTDFLDVRQISGMIEIKQFESGSIMKKILTLVVSAVLITLMLSGCKVISWLSGTGEYSTWGRISDNPAAASEEPSDTTEELSPSTEELSPSAEEPSPAAAVPTVVSDTYAYNSEYIRSSVEMPVISGLADTATQDKINAAFKEYGDKAKADITRMETECRELVEQNPGLDMVYELMATYRVDYNKNGLLCITLSSYYYQGGAHGGEARSSYIFDLATGDRLGLADLMKDGSDYRSFINAAIRQEIDKRVKENILYEIADFEDIGQTPDFYLSDSALVFYFQEYAYFPYAAGIQEFPVAYTDLAGYLNGAYMLG